MRKVIFECSVTSDGFIEGPNGELEWLLPSHPAHDPYGFLSQFDTMFCGLKTYERLGIVKVSAEMNTLERKLFYTLHGMRKYVFSRSEKHVSGNGMVIGDDFEAEVKRIRGEDGKAIWFCGGPDLLKTFMTLDLVDEYFLSVHPVQLRSGKPLFEDMKTPENLRLVNNHRLKSGVIVMHYKPESRIKSIST